MSTPEYSDINEVVAAIERHVGTSNLEGPIRYLRGRSLIDQQMTQRLLEQAKLAVERRSLLQVMVGKLIGLMEAGVRAAGDMALPPEGSAELVCAYVDQATVIAGDLRAKESEYHALVAFIRTQVRMSTWDKEE